jgi:hypothetical protein
MMTTPHSRHLVRWADEARFLGPPEWAPEATGARRWTAVDDQTHAVHTGFGICELEPGGSVPGYVHSLEQSGWTWGTRPGPFGRISKIHGRGRSAISRRPA